MKIENENMATA